jgi:hypothetical protein
MRLAAITLHDVPEHLRRRAAAPLLRRATEEADLAGVVALERAVLFPSQTVYRVPAEAVERVLRV